MPWDGKRKLSWRELPFPASVVTLTVFSCCIRVIRFCCRERVESVGHPVSLCIWLTCICPSFLRAVCTLLISTPLSRDNWSSWHWWNMRKKVRVTTFTRNRSARQTEFLFPSPPVLPLHGKRRPCESRAIPSGPFLSEISGKDTEVLLHATYSARLTQPRFLCVLLNNSYIWYHYFEMLFCVFCLNLEVYLNEFTCYMHMKWKWKFGCTLIKCVSKIALALVPNLGFHNRFDSS